MFAGSEHDAGAESKNTCHSVVTQTDLMALLNSPSRASCGVMIPSSMKILLQVVFRELSGPFGALYKHDVSSSRISPLLEALDEKLGTICASAEPDTHAPIARGLLQAALDALLRVLLHGGPHR